MPVHVAESLGDLTLWRYLTLEKLLALLQSRSLHFARLDTFKDPFEGRAPTGLECGGGLNGEAGWHRSILDEAAPKEVFVSCWHGNPDESAAMWSLYSQTSGVAIRSTVQRLASALMPQDVIVELGGVEYRAITPNFLSGSPWFIKRPSFHHEREVRAIVRTPQVETRGLHVPVDPEQLIAAIHISPESEPWIEPVVVDVVRKYGCPCRVVRSDLYTLP